MTDQKYKIGDKVLAEVYLLGEAYGNSSQDQYYYVKGDENDNSSTKIAMVKQCNIRPYTPKPEFEYGEEVEVQENDSDGAWRTQIFLGFIKGLTHPYITTSKENFDGKQAYYEATLSFLMWSRIRKKLQPKKELIEINGKKYDAEKVKERLADLKAED